LRLAMGALWHDGDGLPFTLLMINLLGSLAIGYVGVMWGGRRHMWALLGPGVLGGFTTFSGIAAATWTTDAGAAASIIALAVSMVVCTLAARAGVTLGERQRQAAR
jgi:CrcB protein